MAKVVYINLTIPTIIFYFLRVLAIIFRRITPPAW